MNCGRESGDAEPLGTVEAILAQLRRHEPLPPDVDDTAAAAAARRQLQRMAELVGSTPNPREPHALKSLRSMLSALSSLTRLCDQKFVTCSYSDIPIAWRAIYVDTQLLKACCALSNISEVAQGEASTLRRCIRDLDLALIVAGAASLSKDQLCHDLIASLQTRLLDLEGADQKRQPGHHGFDGDTRTRKRLKSSPSESWKPTFTTSAQADLCIPEHEFDEAPTFMDLSSVDSTVRSKPFIVRGYAQRTGWPALQSDSSGGSWSSIDHLLNVAGPARVVPVEVGANYTRGDWGQDIMLWSDFLQHCHWEQPALSGVILTQVDETDVEEGPTVLYMAQHDLASQFPALQRDYSLPDYVYTSPPAPKDWPDYKPPVTYDGVIPNLWVGPAGTISPPHHDPYYNCFIQAVGYKEVWVSPPHLRPRKDLEPSEGAVEERSIAETLMANTASVDVFDTAESIPPTVRAAAAKAILEPGDLLYMPPGWWHSLRSLTRSFSVSTWF